MNTRTTNRWTPFVIGGVLLATVVGAAALSGTADDKSAAVPGTGVVVVTDPGSQTAGGTGTAPETTPAPTDPATTVAADTVGAVADVPLTRSLKEGMAGDDVSRLQQRLKDLHFEPGDVTGQFTHLTTQAVWAFQKLILAIPYNQADGMVTQDTWSKMEAAVTVTPKKTNTTATHVEVYLAQQVLVVFKNNAPVLISHVSTGSNLQFKTTVALSPNTPDNPTDQIVTQHVVGDAITPTGTYKFAWRYTSGDGWRDGALGRMYKPTYFVSGVAVHGSGNVPNQPASHGCVRLPMGTTNGAGQPKSPVNPADEFPTLVPLNSQIFLFSPDNPNAAVSNGAPVHVPDPDFTVPDTTVPVTTIPATSAPTTVAVTPAPKTTVPPTAAPAPTTVAPAPSAAPPTLAPEAPASASP